MVITSTLYFSASSFTVPFTTSSRLEKKLLVNVFSIREIIGPELLELFFVCFLIIGDITPIL